MHRRPRSPNQEPAPFPRFVGLLLVAALALPALGAQQLWLAQNDDTTFGNLAVGWPAAVLAFRFTAPTNGVVDAAQVFTGNQTPATHTLELRDHDPLTGLPGNLLGGQGSWITPHVRCFMGTRLPQPVSLVGGQDYWLVWRVTGMFHQHSVSADSPTNVISEVRVSDGNTWHAQAFLAAKFRLFSPHASGPINVYGTGKPGQYGVPSIGISGWPAVGSVIDVWLDDAARRQPAFLLMGLPIPTGIVFPIGTAWTTTNANVLLQTVTETSPFVGGISYTFRVPNLPSAVGFPLSFQWGIVDPLAQDGISHTAGATALLQ